MAYIYVCVCFFCFYLYIVEVAMWGDPEEKPCSCASKPRATQQCPKATCQLLSFPVSPSKCEVPNSHQSHSPCSGSKSLYNLAAMSLHSSPPA